MGIYFGRKERNLKDAVKELFDELIKREMPDNLAETQFMEYGDLDVYRHMRELNEAVNDYIDEYKTRIETLEKQVEDLNDRLLAANKLEED